MYRTGSIFTTFLVNKTIPYPVPENHGITQEGKNIDLTSKLKWLGKIWVLRATL